ncbi:uncharacterized protein LOC106161093 [Lingula anatina]|uniref:Sterile alpha motif domain-containing protein 5 n=1 Tax=Lingula anatina TaxID=7574 RepID=A0A1S3I7Q1_LINAN|nr:uncharacterized protein LOC106161093 [Lingula anatina]|eukprot:XP_013393404.1 uncharacterized protein LOC106161093 [Lingula anatina]
MEENIVENWLRSLNFVGYTQAFLDNGYDDLEVCKQIGEDDLDAIGVVKKSHRKEILKAVHQIREEGATSVYFTLEEPGVTNYPYNDQVSPRPLSNSSSTDTTPTSPSKDIYLPRDYRVDEYEEGKNALVVIPQKKLTAIILEKLSQDRIDLSQLSSQGDVASIEVLAHKYAKEFNTHQSDVLYKLKELQAAGVPTHKETPVPSTSQQVPMSQYYCDHHPLSPSRDQPPPLPAYPPPMTSRAAELYQILSVASARKTTMPGASDKKEESPETKKKSSPFSRLFRSRKSSRKNSKSSDNKEGIELHASQITMSDEDRIQLMVLVKEGKLTPDQAVEVVKLYEEGRKRGIYEDLIVQDPEIRASPPNYSAHTSPEASKNLVKYASLRRKRSSSIQSGGEGEDETFCSSSPDSRRSSFCYDDDDLAPDLIPAGSHNSPLSLRNTQSRWFQRQSSQGGGVGGGSPRSPNLQAHGSRLNSVSSNPGTSTAGQGKRRSRTYTNTSTHSAQLGPRVSNTASPPPSPLSYTSCGGQTACSKDSGCQSTQNSLDSRSSSSSSSSQKSFRSPSSYRHNGGPSSVSPYHVSPVVSRGSTPTRQHSPALRTRSSPASPSHSYTERRRQCSGDYSPNTSSSYAGQDNAGQCGVDVHCEDDHLVVSVPDSEHPGRKHIYRRQYSLDSNIPHPNQSRSVKQSPPVGRHSFNYSNPGGGYASYGNYSSVGIKKRISPPREIKTNGTLLLQGSPVLGPRHDEQRVLPSNLSLTSLAEEDRESNTNISAAALLSPRVPKKEFKKASKTEQRLSWDERRFEQSSSVSVPVSKKPSPGAETFSKVDKNQNGLVLKETVDKLSLNNRDFISKDKVVYKEKANSPLASGSFKTVTNDLSSNSHGFYKSVNNGVSTEPKRVNEEFSLKKPKAGIESSSSVNVRKNIEANSSVNTSASLDGEPGTHAQANVITPSSEELQNGKSTGYVKADVSASPVNNSTDSEHEKSRNLVLAKKTESVQKRSSVSQEADPSYSFPHLQFEGAAHLKARDRDSQIFAELNSQTAEIFTEDEGDLETLPDPGVGDSKFGGSTSTMSVGSDTSPQLERKNGMFERIRKLRMHKSYSYSTGDELHSSDYEDIAEDPDKKLALSGFGRDLSQRSSFSERVKGLKRDVKRRLSRLGKGHRHSDSDVQPNLYLPEEYLVNTEHMAAIPSPNAEAQFGLTSTTHPEVTSPDDTPAYTGQFVGRAIVHTDYTPSPYDKEALTLKQGDIIKIITKAETGNWTGLLRNRVGTFKFINVELIPDETPRRIRRQMSGRKRSAKTRSKPKTVEDLLKRLGLEELLSIFLLNGYDNLELFSELEKEDLNELNILDPEQRAKLLTAAELLADTMDSVDYENPASPETKIESVPKPPSTVGLSVNEKGAPDLTQKTPRDSGCYASNENIITKMNGHQESPSSQSSPENTLKGENDAPRTDVTPVKQEEKLSQVVVVEVKSPSTEQTTEVKYPTRMKMQKQHQQKGSVNFIESKSTSTSPSSSDSASDEVGLKLISTVELNGSKVSSQPLVKETESSNLATERVIPSKGPVTNNVQQKTGDTNSANFPPSKGTPSLQSKLKQPQTTKTQRMPSTSSETSSDISDSSPVSKIPLTSPKLRASRIPGGPPPVTTKRSGLKPPSSSPGSMPSTNKKAETKQEIPKRTLPIRQSSFKKEKSPPPVPQRPLRRTLTPPERIQVPSTSSKSTKPRGLQKGFSPLEKEIQKPKQNSSSGQGLRSPGATGATGIPQTTTGIPQGATGVPHKSSSSNQPNGSTIPSGEPRAPRTAPPKPPSRISPPRVTSTRRQQYQALNMQTCLGTSDNQVASSEASSPSGHFGSPVTSPTSIPVPQQFSKIPQPSSGQKTPPEVPKRKETTELSTKRTIATYQQTSGSQTKNFNANIPSPSNRQFCVNQKNEMTSSSPSYIKKPNLPNNMQNSLGSEVQQSQSKMERNNNQNLCTSKIGLPQRSSVPPAPPPRQLQHSQTNLPCRLPQARQSAHPVTDLANQSSTSSQHSKHTKVQQNAPRTPSVTLETLITLKLEDEMIDLTQPPYSDQSGYCGIPAALVQRYAEELKRELSEMASALDQLRVKQLQQKGREGISNNYLVDSSSRLQLDLCASSLRGFLETAGLPMYAALLEINGFWSLDSIKHLTEKDLVQLGVQDPRHCKRLVRAFEALRFKSESSVQHNSPRHLKKSVILDKV